MRRVVCLLLVNLFLFSMFIIPAEVTSNSSQLQDIGENEFVARMDNALTIPSEVAEQTIRVAVYDEPNGTAPVYATHPGSEHNNATGLRDILEEAGYQATLLDVTDIYNDALTVADFDAIILPDNFPRESITMKIRNFWLDGGGILSIDGSSGYLCYFGILPPEASGTSGSSDYWTYTANDIRIEMEHPISQDFSEGNLILTPSGYLCWNWSTLQETSIADNLIRIGSSDADPDTASVLAYEPSGTEGRIVTIAHDYNSYIPLIDAMIPDAVKWLSQSDQPEYIEHTVRVAVYDESNTTSPDYGPGPVPGTLQYTAPEVADMLTSYGYQVTLLDMEAILDHELMTADFDVFIMADSLPWLNLTNMIREYWMGGGALFAMDSSISFLTSFGIIGSGTYGNGTYWDYVGSDITVSTRHPVTKAYQLGDTLEVYWDDYAAWNWTTLQGTPIADDLTRLAYSASDEDLVTALAFDPSDRGGKVVTLSYSFVHALPEIHQLMADAMDWLCPRPKGRILFDVSHYSYYPVDPWDNTGLTGSRYTALRDDLVSRHYTFDKYYGGNFTADGLAPYDMLIINTPETLFTSSEVVVVTDWVTKGGGLLPLGDNSGFTQENDNLNFLLSNFSLEINSALNYDVFDFTTSDISMHPIREGFPELYFSGGCYVNYTGAAYSLVMDGGSTVVAAQEFGLGRVILASDINFLANFIDNSDNHQFGINVANWLTSCTADVLLYVDTAMHDPNNNVYRGPVAQALNDLGISFHLTFSHTFFEWVLFENDWDLVVFDNINYITEIVFDDILDYLENGGKLIINTWRYSATTSLWNYIGFEYGGQFFSPPPDIHLWDSDSLLLSSYGDDSIITDADFDFGIECMSLTVFDNATAMGGLSPSPSTTNVSVILGADERAIANGMLLSMYANDTDDSTYTDSFEIWRDEIAFLMFNPQLGIDSPTDIQYEAGTTGNEVTWSPTSNSPSHYTVFRDGSEVGSGPWDGSPIAVDVDGNDPGTFVYELVVSHATGHTITDSILVVVVDTTAPVFVSTPSDMSFAVGTTGNLLNWTATELYPDQYELWIDGVLDSSGAWDGSTISVSVDGLGAGTHNCTLVLIDSSGNSAVDYAIMTVIPEGNYLLVIAILAGVGGVVLVVIIIFLKKKKSSGGE